jgi:HAD superfamily hydrolase (TIGR01459 family)
MKIIMIVYFILLLQAHEAKKTSRQTMMRIPIIQDGFKVLSERYSIISWDQFGVLHDGARPLCESVAVLRELDRMGVKQVVCSNTSKRAAKAHQIFSSKIGLPDVIPITSFMTSGEAAWQYLNKKSDFRGEKVLWFTWKDWEDDKFVDDLGMSVTSDVEEADLLLFHGSQTIACEESGGVRIELFKQGTEAVQSGIIQQILRRAAERDLPSVCANMDYSAITHTGAKAWMPGILVDAYEELGGKCEKFGKPFPDHFTAAVDSLEPSIDTQRVLHVGDSLHHDITGANSAGFDSCLITDTGVHRGDLEGCEIEAVCELAEKYNVPRPTYIMDSVRW